MFFEELPHVVVQPLRMWIRVGHAQGVNIPEIR
jgi:hypothetical protein